MAIKVPEDKYISREGDRQNTVYVRSNIIKYNQIRSSDREKKEEAMH